MQGLAGLFSWLLTTRVGTASLLGIVWTLGTLVALVLTLSLLRTAYDASARATNKAQRRRARVERRNQWRWAGIYGGLLLLGVISLFAPTKPRTPDAILWSVGVTMGLLIFVWGIVLDVRDRDALERHTDPPPSP